MRDALVEGARAAAPCAIRANSFAASRTSTAGRDRNLAIVLRVGPLDPSGLWSAVPEGLLLRNYAGQIRSHHRADGQQAGLFRTDLNATAAAMIFFAAR